MARGEREKRAFEIVKNYLSKNNNKIPVIGNNKLKPEIINNNDDISFPDLKKKEGEVLWKETL